VSPALRAARAPITAVTNAPSATIPESAIGDVLVRLGKAAAEIRKLPGRMPKPFASYQQLYDALHQIQRLVELSI